MYFSFRLLFLFLQLSLWQRCSGEVETKKGELPESIFATPLREKPIGVCQQGHRQEVTDGMKGKVRSHEGTREHCQRKMSEVKAMCREGRQLGT